MNFNSLSPILISQLNTKKIGGGVEVFIQRLKAMFPKITIVDTNDITNISRFEHITAKMVTKFALKNYDLKNYDFIITLGIGGWYLAKKYKGKIPPRLNFFRGSWLGMRNYCFYPLSKKYIGISILKIPYEKQSGINAQNIAISKFVSKSLVEEKMNNIRYLYNTTLLEYEHKSNDHILFIGRPTYEKGFDIFLKVVQRNPNEQFVAILFSNKIIKKYYDNLQIFYNISHEDISKYYEKAKLLLFPSRYEGGGTVVLEALKGEIPVIISNVGSLWEFDKIPGIKVDSWNFEDYVVALRNFLENGTKKDPKKFFEDHFSIEIIKGQWTDLLNKIL